MDGLAQSRTFFGDLERNKQIKDAKQCMYDAGFTAPDAQEIIVYSLQNGCFEALQNLTTKGK